MLPGPIKALPRAPPPSLGTQGQHPPPLVLEPRAAIAAAVPSSAPPMISAAAASLATRTAARAPHLGKESARAFLALSPSFFCANALAGAPLPPPNHPSARPDLPCPSLARPVGVSRSPRRARHAGALGMASHALQRRHGEPQCRSHGAAAAAGSLPPCARPIAAAVHRGPGGLVPRPGPQRGPWTRQPRRAAWPVNRPDAVSPDRFA